MEPTEYPATRRDEACVDELHGVVVADPYRWAATQPGHDCMVRAREDVCSVVWWWWWLGGGRSGGGGGAPCSSPCA